MYHDCCVQIWYINVHVHVDQRSCRYWNQFCCPNTLHVSTSLYMYITSRKFSVYIHSTALFLSLPHLFSALLLAYIAGNTTLCDALIKSRAHPGIANKQSVSIFTAPVATKQLMFRILDQISHEPTWLEGNFCQNCNMKFNISHRKHHWWVTFTL